MPLQKAGVNLDEIEALVDTALVAGRGQEQMHARMQLMFTPWSVWKALISEVRMLREALALRNSVEDDF
jgi:hypothetical protein